jgi:hypothetical protein
LRLDRDVLRRRIGLVERNLANLLDFLGEVEVEVELLPSPVEQPRPLLDRLGLRLRDLRRHRRLDLRRRPLALDLLARNVVDRHFRGSRRLGAEGFGRVLVGLGEIGISGPARRAKGLVLEPLQLVVGGALAPLQIEVLSYCVVQNPHRSTLHGRK